MLLGLLAFSTVEGKPIGEAGYNYPVPDNPLVLPTRKTTTTTTTSKPEKEEGYNYPVPENALSVSTTTTTTTTEAAGYSYVTPENPLTLPTKATTTTEKGYEYPVPENPLVLPTKAPIIRAELPPCPQESDEPEIDLRSFTPGLDCKPVDVLVPEALPPCPEDTDIDLRSFTPGLDCIPNDNAHRSGGGIRLLDDNFQVDLKTLQEELPDFVPEEFFKNDEVVPAPLTTPSSIPEEESQRLLKVSFIEPILVKTCIEMEDGEANPGVNCVDDRTFSLLDEDVFKTCLELAQDGQFEAKPGVNCIHEVPLLILEDDEQQDLDVQPDLDGEPKLILGKDFNLATAIDIRR